MRRTGNEGLHERVVEDKRERQLERLTWAEAAEALDAAALALSGVPDPGLGELAMMRRLGTAAARARSNAKTEALEAVKRLENEEL